MGKPTGFIEIPRKPGGYRPVQERTGDFGEVEQRLNDEDRRAQAARCMDCGVPFCHWACLLGNRNPEWQDALYKGNYREAYELLTATNPFPEFTGRVCPALCEKSCVLNLHNEPVTVRENECAVIEQAFEKGYVKPGSPFVRTGKRVAVIGSGPAGLAVADRLNRLGHKVTVYEARDAAGGLLRYGIPDFKLQKSVIDRRLEIMEAGGICFRVNNAVGKDIEGAEIYNYYDAVCLATGAMIPRDLAVPGRNLSGIHFALDFLMQQNKMIRGIKVPEEQRLTAEGKHVLIIGGGDTGADCVGTAIRQKALSVTQIEIMPEPPSERMADNPWPYWPNVLRTSSSHLEGCDRRWSLATKGFLGKDGRVTAAKVIGVTWSRSGSGQRVMSENGKKSQVLKADMVLLCMGFLPEALDALVKKLGLDTGRESKKLFVCGDARTGPGLVLRAIAGGISAAEDIDTYLKTM